MQINLFQIIFITFLIFSIIGIVKKKKKSTLKPIETLVWTIIWLIGGVLIMFPSISTTISNFLGITRGTDAIVYTSIILLFFFLYRANEKIDKLERMIRDLTSKLAIKKQA